ncbi:MAG: tRNA 2-thiouridine(34) synthase MnmA [Peptoniphilaceae bacterium]|jgi:tRNA-specific 2-thiouridylase
MKRVVLGMSGGVDSSVSAGLLKEQGYEVVGLFMKNWDEENADGICTAAEDALDARLVADALQIPFYTVNFEKEYLDRVFSYFLREYQRGRTPNPDILCNREIKFNAFLHYALQLEADYIAMGHYADQRTRDGRTELLRGADTSKDQSYFLCRIKEEALSRCLFPIGSMQKEEVRAWAKEHKLVTANKKDSTGICFIGERDFNAFLDQHLETRPGEIHDEKGAVVGYHTGLMHYTLGQRKGMGIGGVGSGEPWFVSGKNTQNNVLYAVQGEAHPALFSRGLYAREMVWIGEEKETVFTCTAKVRYRQEDVPAVVTQMGHGEIRVDFPDTVRAATPGQTIALYDKERCLGGAVIDRLVPVDAHYAYMNPVFEANPAL